MIAYKENTRVSLKKREYVTEPHGSGQWVTREDGEGVLLGFCVEEYDNEAQAYALVEKDGGTFQTYPLWAVTKM